MSRKKRVLSPEIYDHDFAKLAKETKSSAERRRFLALARVVEGKSNAEIVKELKIGENSISKWIKKFNKEGIEGLRGESRGSRVISNEMYDYDFIKLAKESKSPLEQRRFLALARVVEGKSNAEIVQELEIGESSIPRWLKRFNEEGIEGLRERDLSPEIYEHDFVKLAEETTYPRERLRFFTLALVAEGKSNVEIVKELKIGKPSIAAWIKKFNESGIEGLRGDSGEEKKRSPKKYNFDFVRFAKEAKSSAERRRFLALTQMGNGKSVSEVAKELNVSVMVVYKWLRLFREEGLKGLKDKRKDIKERFSTKIYDYDFAKLADETENKKDRLHFLVFEQLAKGEEAQKISQEFKISVTSIYSWIEQFNEKGIEGRAISSKLS